MDVARGVRGRQRLDFGARLVGVEPREGGRGDDACALVVDVDVREFVGGAVKHDALEARRLLGAGEGTAERAVEEAVRLWADEADDAPTRRLEGRAVHRPDTKGDDVLGVERVGVGGDVVVNCLRREAVAAEEPPSVGGVDGVDLALAVVEVDVEALPAVDGWEVGLGHATPPPARRPAGWPQ
mgnify:CR=1 FL=1